MREAAIIAGEEVVNVIVLPDGAAGDVLLSDSVVEITGMHPKPGIGLGWTYVDGAFVPPVPPALTWDDIRAERDWLLSQCDWTQVADSPLTVAQKQAWADYRQALRNVPQDFPTPDDVAWPEAP